MVVARRAEAAARAAGVFIALVAALLVFVLAGQAAAIAAASLSSTDGYNSDAAPGSTNIIDGSPPILFDTTTGYDSVDLGSLDTSARPETSAHGPDYTYTSGAMLVRAVASTATTERRVVVTGGEFPRLAASRVAAKTADNVLPGLPASAPKPLGLGSTGRTTPENLTEQLAMTEVRSAPGGAPIPRGTMSDPRWMASDGWVKMQQIVNGVNVHYVRDTVTGAVDDFKFVTRR